MAIELKKNLPLGVSILRYFYLVNAVLLIISSIIFSKYLNVVVCGKITPVVVGNLIRIFLIIMPLYLAIGFSLLQKTSLYAAVTYQIFFILNGILTTIYLATNENFLCPLFG